MREWISQNIPIITGVIVIVAGLVAGILLRNWGRRGQ